jgi:hypothetical protein
LYPIISRERLANADVFMRENVHKHAIFLIIKAYNVDCVVAYDIIKIIKKSNTHTIKEI